jgi:hypothetical protein
VVAVPVSGNLPTIRGAVSQTLPGSMDAVWELRVVLADGTVPIIITPAA